MLERVRQRQRDKTICFSLELWEKIEQVCDENISPSSFIRMAVMKELKRRGIG